MATGKLIGSLPVEVESVQALAASLTTSDHIPTRYSRPEAESEPVMIITGDAEDDIPVIDFHKLLDPELSDAESSKLDLACQNWGFFQLINHGVSEEVIQKMMLVIEEFFKLPLDEKMLVKQRPGQLEGYGQMFVISEEQKLDWADILYFCTSPLHLRKNGFWPTKPSTFRDALDKYSMEVKKLSNCLLGFMAKNLGLAPAEMARMLENGTQYVRINCYPPCPEDKKVLGVSPHSDASFLTLLLQVNDVQGLQIRRNDKWFPVKPLPGAFVANIADAFEILSNGKYKSIEHRAVTNTEKERFSIAAFHGPNFNAIIGPHSEFVLEDEPLYKSLDYESYMKLRYASKLDGKNFLGRMKLNN
ncbi:S-norcoclaurine synthase 1-like isoform X2 [Dioscorea cayenensis subsp. rotundata]|uniref:S-norcoclaurine synthase 1-like isoform X2 n=1 Tax=Dioscorea cayennensis subsp. rotundata TaxID=55577 RepID=A0AB40B6E0_DIOCR|nr:S-norcoclaurine synthase 1-like isoform X2 [Dioscorea cayenensis subsp. rotundata]